ncbi:hypothetical protein [Kaarinaea lacus]
MSEKNSLFAKILALLGAGGATIIGAIIGISPDMLGFKSDGNNQNLTVQNQSQSISKTEIHIHATPGAVSEVVSKSTDTPNEEKILITNKQDVVNSAPHQPMAVKSVPETNPVAQAQSQPVNTATPKATPVIDLTGTWQFDVDIIRGKDTTGTLFDFNSKYKPFVELTQLGDKITGTYSAPPAVICGTGAIVGSLSEGNETTKVEWILNCTSECEGEQRKFTGTYNQVTKTIAGRYVPVKTPTKKGCWLAFENLSGKLD